MATMGHNSPRAALAGWLVAAVVGVIGLPGATAAPDASSDSGDDGLANASQANTAPGPPAASLEQTFQAPDPLRVGSRLKLNLDVDHPPTTTVHLPDNFGNPRWEVVGAHQRELPNQGGAQRTRLAVDFQIFRPGSTTLPSFPVTVMSDDGGATELHTDPVEAKVISVLPADQTPAPKSHRPPVAIWADDYTLAWAGGIALAAFLAGAAAFWVARRDDNEDDGPPPRPAHVIALEKLSALTTDDLLDRGAHMIYYVRLSEAVREYLGRRYGFRGTELTTTEILDHLQAVDWPAGISLSDVRQWLLHCDLIKFSGVIPKRERSEQALRRGFSIVELTRDRPAPGTDAAKDDSRESPKPAAVDDSSPSEDKTAASVSAASGDHVPSDDSPNAGEPSPRDNSRADVPDDQPTDINGQPTAYDPPRSDPPTDAATPHPSHQTSRADGGER